MSAADFIRDLERKPESLDRLADAFGTSSMLAGVPRTVERVTMLGMGSSRYAAEAVAARLRAAGIASAAELASAELGTAPGPGTLVIAISASGESAETLDALERHRGRSRLIAVTNRPGSAITRGVDSVIDLVAGEESGGVVCRSFQHTLIVLRAIAARLAGERFDGARVARRVGVATASLLDRRGAWLDAVAHALDGPDGVYALAPAERWSSAAQAALMIREAPRRAATACETGDWAHVDVYLAKTLDYRALLFTGSRWDGQALDWLRRRNARVVAVGGEVAGALVTVRYPGDADPDVAVATEVLVAELVAASWWDRQERASAGTGS